ncbi:SDR family oxidoreductase [Spirosoma sp. KNUC1025]|uniref:SDR family oxidoreductase n=1 Tax=Spirosoma sp. KNUC1025 TaxID=2894082 RepID=UPI00386C3780|nr:SDR family oxidoreductase [Spirosoma sp. KNUC1025]
MQTIFITGASSGLGKATAKLFQSKGWKVIATMRQPEKETELTALENVSVLPLDVTNDVQIEATVQEVLESAKIDVVFNNAGYGLGGALEACTDSQITDQINTNLTGVLRVSKAFIPYFRQQRSGLFITTTSVFGFSACPLSSVYNATKWALEGWSESMAYELAPFNITVKTVAPGGIKSSFVGNMQATVTHEYDSLSSRMNNLFADGTLIEFTEAERIAEVVYEAATDGKDQLRYLAGNDAIRIAEQRQQMGTEGYRKYLTQLLTVS